MTVKNTMYYEKMQQNCLNFFGQQKIQVHLLPYKIKQFMIYLKRYFKYTNYLK